MEKSKYFLIAILLLAGFTQCKPKAAETGKPVPAASSAELSKADASSITNTEISSWEFAKTKQLDKLNNLLADDVPASSC